METLVRNDQEALSDHFAVFRGDYEILREHFGSLRDSFASLRSLISDRFVAAE